jgi:crotonobetainyl-CoA:carnitine CoA-transferase CaiB-like acyl-CoA transferase
MEIFEREDIPAEPVLALREAREHPQARRRGVVSEGPDGLPRLAFPARFDGERPLPERSGGAVPELGEHTAAVLREIGAAAAELSERKRSQAGIGPKLSWMRGLKRGLRRWIGR